MREETRVKENKIWAARILGEVILFDDRTITLEYHHLLINDRGKQIILEYSEPGFKPILIKLLTAWGV